MLSVQVIRIRTWWPRLLTSIVGKTGRDRSSEIQAEIDNMSPMGWMVTQKKWLKLPLGYVFRHLPPLQARRRHRWRRRDANRRLNMPDHTFLDWPFFEDPLSRACSKNSGIGRRRRSRRLRTRSLHTTKEVDDLTRTFVSKLGEGGWL